MASTFNHKTVQVKSCDILWGKVYFNPAWTMSFVRSGDVDFERINKQEAQLLLRNSRSYACHHIKIQITKRFSQFAPL